MFLLLCSLLCSLFRAALILLVHPVRIDAGGKSRTATVVQHRHGANRFAYKGGKTWLTINVAYLFRLDAWNLKKYRNSTRKTFSEKQTQFFASATSPSTGVSMNRIDDFLHYLKAELGLKELTIVAYGFDMRAFEEAVHKPLESLTREDIRNFLAKELQTAQPRSVARKLSTVRHFYRYLLNEEVIRVNPTQGIPVPKTWQTVPKSISAGEVGKIIEALSIKTPAGLRDRAMLLTCFGAGLRVSEMLSIRLDDLDLRASTVTVRQGKGLKDGIAPLNPVAIAALQSYLEIARPQLHPGESPLVFVSGHGELLTRQYVFLVIREVGERVLGKAISPHWLRHAFATTLIEGGADLRAVQAMMRHSSIDTTQMYLDIDLTALRVTYYNTHPRARRHHARQD
jgi:integrase/recombinase XerD